MLLWDSESQGLGLLPWQGTQPGLASSLGSGAEDVPMPMPTEGPASLGGTSLPTYGPNAASCWCPAQQPTAQKAKAPWGDTMFREEDGLAGWRGGLWVRRTSAALLGPVSPGQDWAALGQGQQTQAGVDERSPAVLPCSVCKPLLLPGDQQDREVGPAAVPSQTSLQGPAGKSCPSGQLLNATCPKQVLRV